MDKEKTSAIWRFGYKSTEVCYMDKFRISEKCIILVYIYDMQQDVLKIDFTSQTVSYVVNTT